MNETKTNIVVDASGPYDGGQTYVKAPQAGIALGLVAVAAFMLGFYFGKRRKKPN
jgi:LPXTG-motif cell wall-anchored protein